MGERPRHIGSESSGWDWRRQSAKPIRSCEPEHQEPRLSNGGWRCSYSRRAQWVSLSPICQYRIGIVTVLFHQPNINMANTILMGTVDIIIKKKCTCQYCNVWLHRICTSKVLRSFLWLKSLTKRVSIDWCVEMEPNINDDILRLMEPKSPWGVLKFRHCILGRPSVVRGVNSKMLAVVVATRQPKGMASLRVSHSCPCCNNIATHCAWRRNIE